MNKLLHIQDGMVFICGPTSTGKTTLAKRIFEEAPYPDKVLISHDEMLQKFLAENSLDPKLFYEGLDDATDQKFRAYVVLSVRDALHSHKFVIHESTCCSRGDSATQVRDMVASFPILGLDRPLTVVKMWPSLSMQLQFVNERPAGMRPTKEAVLAQRATFKPTAMASNFTDEGWIREYRIDNPREVSLDFKRRGELSKELLTAFSNWEDLNEKFPELMDEMSNIMGL